MPSPFPGMDPYVENSHGWRGLHTLLLGEISALLPPQLNAIGYYVDLEEQVYLGEWGREVIPDAVLHEGSQELHRDMKPTVAVVDEPIVVEEVREERVPYLEVCRSDDNRIVTVIELLSSIKKIDNRGREQYMRKRRELTQDEVGFVEIDLLRTGPLVVDLPFEVLERHPHDYLVNTICPYSTHAEFYAIRLCDRLPRIRIPLEPEDPDAALDLQAAFNSAYDRGPDRIRIDYTTDPPPPKLSDDDLNWIDTLLRQKGLCS
jgi:hypothetical protein